MVAASDGEADEVMAAVAALKQRDQVLEADLPRPFDDAHAAAYLNQLSSDSDDEVPPCLF